MISEVVKMLLGEGSHQLPWSADVGWYCMLCCCCSGSTSIKLTVRGLTGKRSSFVIVAGVHKMRGLTTIDIVLVCFCGGPQTRASCFSCTQCYEQDVFFSCMLNKPLLYMPASRIAYEGSLLDRILLVLWGYTYT